MKHSIVKALWLLVLVIAMAAEGYNLYITYRYGVEFKVGIYCCIFGALLACSECAGISGKKADK